MAGSGEPVRSDQVRDGLKDDSPDKRQIAGVPRPWSRSRSESLPPPLHISPPSLGMDQVTGPGLLPQTHSRVLGLSPSASSALQSCERRPLLPVPFILAALGRCQARGLGRPSMKHEARAPALNLVPWPSSARLIKPAVRPRARGDGGAGVLSFCIPCSPSAEPSSGHPAQSRGKGETRTTFASKSFCLKPLQQNHQQRG